MLISEHTVYGISNQLIFIIRGDEELFHDYISTSLVPFRATFVVISTYKKPTSCSLEYPHMSYSQDHKHFSTFRHRINKDRCTRSCTIQLHQNSCDFGLTFIVKYQIWIQEKRWTKVLEALILLLVRHGDGAFPESVAEPPPDNLEVGHTAGAGHLPSDGLLGPVVLTHSSTWESAWRAERKPIANFNALKQK